MSFGKLKLCFSYFDHINQDLQIKESNGKEILMSNYGEINESIGGQSYAEKYVLMRLDEDDNQTFYALDNIQTVNKKIKKQGFVPNDLLKDRKTRTQVVIEEIGTNKS